MMSANQMIMVVFPLYIRDLGIASSFLGGVMALSAFFAMLARPVSGYLADKKGRQIVMYIGIGIMLAGAVGMIFLPFMIALALIRGFHGFGIAATTTGQMAIATDVLPEKEVKRGLSYFGVCFPIAGAIGPSIGLALIFGSNFMPVWLGSVVLFFVAIIIIATLKYERKLPVAPTTTEVPEENDGGEITGIWRYFEKSALRPSIIFFIITLANAGVVVFLPVYAVDIGIENIGIFFILQSGAMFLSNVIVGNTIHRFKSPLLFLMIATISLAFAMFTLFMTTDIITLAIAAILCGIGVGVSTVTVSTVVMAGAQPERRGAASGTFQLSLDVGFCIGPFIWGLVVSALGYRYLYGLLIPFPVIAAVISLLFYARKRKSSDIQVEGNVKH